MNKKLQLLFMICNAAGYLTLAVTKLFLRNLPDFWLGFFEGFSMICILIGFAYLIWCLVKGRNPYRVQES
ncbi:MAG: hypothetical protein KBA53_10425 [Thermoclostridium sp.]|nr:hypothetical protein [Thermoclostridium sp.]